MQKLYSQLVGLPVFDEHSGSPVTLVRDVIIDPENGKVLAFMVKNQHIIVPLDVEKLNNGLFIHDRDRILHINEVLRVQEVHSKRHAPIIGAKAITERGKIYLGRVVDYEIDALHMVLTRIHTAKVFFFFRFQERIISYRHIVKIGKDTVIVKDSHEAEVMEKAKARSSAYAA